MDSKLIEYFENNQSEFQRIKEAIDTSNAKEVLGLILELERERKGVKMGHVSGPHSFLFILSPTEELHGGGYYHFKAIAWCDNKPDSLIADLDDAPKAFGQYYRHIRGNWYLYLQTSHYKK